MGGAEDQARMALSQWLQPVSLVLPWTIVTSFGSRHLEDNQVSVIERGASPGSEAAGAIVSTHSPLS